MKVLSIVPYQVLPAKLGGEKSISIFNEYLGKHIPLIVVSTRNNDSSLAENYNMYNELSDSRIRYLNIFQYFFFRRLIQKENITHLIIEHPYFGWLGYLLAKTLSLKFIVRSQNIEYMRSKSIGRWWWKALKWYEQWVYKVCDLIFFISEDDRNFAVNTMGISPGKSLTATYGIRMDKVPEGRSSAREIIEKRHDIKPGETILLFNGALYHHTNYDAVTIILKEINPELIRQNLPYKIIICGKGLPDSFNELKEYRDKGIIYAGFVDDISEYFLAADIFLNPIMAGGGIKTKAVEALAHNCTVISTEIGAMGLKREVCGNKLSVVGDKDWHSFSRAVISAFNNRSDIPGEFFQYYYWGNIVEMVIRELKKL